MIQSQAHFTNIRHEIIKCLASAQKDILVAVAWFTDETLLDALAVAQKRGVRVQICVSDDEINNGERALPWTKLTAGGGSVIFKKETLMHHKFCVIDGIKVLSGSYNWTKKAALQNDENLIITSGDYELAESFTNEFRRVTGQALVTASATESQQILKRLKLIVNLIDLGDSSEILRYTEIIRAEARDKAVFDIVKLLQERKYTDALNEIEKYLRNNSVLAQFSDPEVAALKLEIRLLEYEIVALENEKAECEKILREFDLMFQNALGDLILKILEVKKEYARRHRHESQFAEEEYQAAERRHHEQVNSGADLLKEETKMTRLSEEEQDELKKAYRKAVLLCHPDRVAEQYKEEATRVFRSLHDAYMTQDTETVQSILIQLNKGLFVMERPILDKEHLLKTKHNMLQKKKKLEYAITTLKASQRWEICQDKENVKDYLKTKKKQLENELEKLHMLQNNG